MGGWGSVFFNKLFGESAMSDLWTANQKPWILVLWLCHFQVVRGLAELLNPTSNQFECSSHQIIVRIIFSHVCEAQCPA